MLAPETIRSIEHDLAINDLTLVEIAAKHNCSRGTVFEISTGKLTSDLQVAKINGTAEGSRFLPQTFADPNKPKVKRILSPHELPYDPLNTFSLRKVIRLSNGEK